MMKPAPTFILLALAERDCHGYAIMQAVRERSGGQVPLRTASLYRHLAQLIDDGLVAESSVRPADDDPRRGAYYRITARGHRAIAAERRRLADLLAAIDGLQPISKRGQA